MTSIADAPIEIRPFEAADTEAVNALLRGLWPDDPSMLQVYRWRHQQWPESPHIRRTLVAVAGGQVVGAGSLFHTSLAPGRLMAAINVAKGRQRRGIGTALYDALMTLSDGRPWLVQVAPVRDPAGAAFLAKRGFRTAITTITGKLDPASAPVRDWMATLPREVPGYRIVPFDDPQSAVSAEDIAIVHAAIAAQYHTWNPHVDVSAEQAIAIFCGDKVVAGSQLCVYVGDDLAGGTHLIGNPFGPDASDVYLANFGVVGPDRPGAHEVTAALARRCLEFAAERGLRVGFEADDPYVPHWALFESAPATDVSRDFAIMVND
jgi:GNAT superfamily N-acetyltransferase